jgi:hypothetical protein
MSVHDLLKEGPGFLWARKFTRISIEAQMRIDHGRQLQPFAVATRCGLLPLHYSSALAREEDVSVVCHRGRSFGSLVQCL